MSHWTVTMAPVSFSTSLIVVRLAKSHSNGSFVKCMCKDCPTAKQTCCILVHFIWPFLAATQSVGSYWVLLFFFTAVTLVGKVGFVSLSQKTKQNACTYGWIKTGENRKHEGHPDVCNSLVELLLNHFAPQNTASPSDVWLHRGRLDFQRNKTNR